jgi:hypothetical protein
MGFAGVGGPENRDYAALRFAPTRSTNARDQTVHVRSIRFSPPDFKRQMFDGAHELSVHSWGQVQAAATVKSALTHVTGIVVPDALQHPGRHQKNTEPL